MRKYEVYWETLKRDGTIAIAITSKLTTIPQLEVAFNQLKRAIQKEKYLDIHYKQRCPNAILSSELDFGEKIIKFKLDSKNIDDLLQGI